MRISSISKVVCSFGAILVLAAMAAGQSPGTDSNCQPLGGFISTNVGGLVPTLLWGSWQATLRVRSGSRLSAYPSGQMA